MLYWFGTVIPTTLLIVLEVVLLGVALVIAPLDRRPSSALAWILLIVVLPLVGLVLFALIGSPNLPRDRRIKQRAMNEQIEETTKDVGRAVPMPDVPTWLPSVARFNRSMGAMPVVDGNTAHVLAEFPAQLAALITAVEKARAYVYVEFYILALDDTTRPFFDALGVAVARGVEVRLLLDHLGSRRYPGFVPAKNELTRLGVQWCLMLPVQPLRGRYQRPDLRNHRKLVVVDGEVGFVGSLNMIDPSYERPRNLRRGLRWRDLLVEVRGPVVQEIKAVFATDWFSETGEMPATGRLVAVADDDNPTTLLGQIVPSGPAFETENNLALFNSLLFAAEERVSITSPYFVPDESLLGAIATAARRGVAVELFVGGIGDQFVVFHAQHSYYKDLLEAGVRIYEYQPPTILHSKHVSVDDRVALVGSSNMDIRSFQLDLEVMMLVCGRSFTDELRAVEDAYRARSSELTLAGWQRRGRLHTFVDNFTRLTSAVQ